MPLKGCSNRSNSFCGRFCRQIYYCRRLTVLFGCVKWQFKINKTLETSIPRNLEPYLFPVHHLTTPTRRYFTTSIIRPLTFSLQPQDFSLQPSAFNLISYYLQQLIPNWILRILFNQEFGINFCPLRPVSFQIEIGQGKKIVRIIRLQFQCF